MKQILRSALILALAAASGTAAALGLGQIQVKSKLGQPLLAEIPIITNDPAELEALQARRPSDEVFERVGIQPPTGLAATLQYAYAVDARGNPVIRITTAEPVSEPLLTFVVEVDWTSGRLVREYSALVDTPAAVASAAQPSVDMPTVSPPNVIERPVVEDPVLDAIAQTPAPLPVPEAPEPELEPEPAPVAAEESALPSEAIAATAPMPAPMPQPEPQPEPEPVAAIPVPQPEPAPVEPEARTPVASNARPNELRVEKGDTLSQLAGQVGADSLDQAMVALLRANPDAFIRGNINELKAGAVLRVPDPDTTSAVRMAEARALVRAQMQEWRQHRSVRQPDVTDSALATADDAGSGAGQASRSARLEIVPPGASKTKKAGNQSGIETGGEGQMLRQELQETKETLAARDAEVEELKSRLSELEQLQADQQQLISMKDSELAAAQKRLAEGPAESQQAKTAEADSGDMMPWIAGSGALVFLALIGAWLLRRRSNGRQPEFRAPGAAVARRPSIADAVPIPGRAPVSDEPFAEQAMQNARAQVMARARAEADVGEYGPVPTAATQSSAQPQAPSQSQSPREDAVRPHSQPQQAREEPMFEQAEPLRAVAAGPVVAQASVGGEAVQLPFWDRRQRQPMPSGRAAPPNLRSVPTSSPTPTVQAPAMGAAPQVSSTPAAAPSVPPPWHGAGAGGHQQWHEPVPTPTVESGGGAGHDRLELAQAYLDLGDDSSARQLLVEVATNGDAAARQKAARMLLDLEQG